jgi:hypothetical protein
MGVLCRSTGGWPLWELTTAERTVTNFESRDVRCFVDDFFMVWKIVLTYKLL